MRTRSFRTRPASQRFAGRTGTAAAVATIVGAAGLVAGLVAAGPLNPSSGVVQSTYKTLGEVEPRIAINAVNTSGTFNSVYQISSPGSYYLTGNVHVGAGKSAIEINATGVTIDLNGFELIGSPTSLGGITLGINSGGPIVVRNGVVRGFNGTGIFASTDGSVVESVQVVGNAGVGIHLGAGCIARDCVVSDNVSDGINASDTALITGCTVLRNMGSGITTTQGANVTRCNVRSNSGTGILTGVDSIVANCNSRYNTGSGIIADSNSTVVSCNASTNSLSGIEAGFDSLIRDCVVDANHASGIQVIATSTIADCVATGNIGDGLRLGNGCFVRSNSCVNNGAGVGDGAGIHATGPSNRIEQNYCGGNDRGIDVDAVNNFIFRNTCASNTTNWTVVANNTCLVVNGAFSGAINGNTGGVASGSTDPNANFSH